MRKKGGSGSGGGGGGGERGEEGDSANGREGFNLLGEPTFKELENGRFKCVETGHELPAHAKDSYAWSKHCRLGIIDAALSKNKPPLNMFRHDPANRSKLICKLTGDTVNKSEEHIWKHMSGKRFLRMLEKKEAKNEMANGRVEKLEENEAAKKRDSKASRLDKKKNKKKEIEEASKIVSEIRDSSEKNSDSEEEAEFWMPPVGDRWDFDDGGDRWGSGSESGQEEDYASGEDGGTEEDNHDAVELSKRAKRMSLEIGPSGFASRKKKKKTGAT